MILKYAFLFLIVFLLSDGCTKNDNTNNSIDLSKQWIIDHNANVISGLNDGQWERKTFSSKEKELFNSLDTTDLSGTIRPDSINQTINSAYPNPFINTHAFSFIFNQGYSGEIVFKYIIVDSNFNPVESLVGRLISLDTYASIACWPDISKGKYRLYFTLSSKSHPHFYQSWGNIEKI